METALASWGGVKRENRGMVMDAGSDIEMVLNWGFGGGLKGEEEALGVGDNEGGGAEKGCLTVAEAWRAISTANSHLEGECVYLLMLLNVWLRGLYVDCMMGNNCFSVNLVPFPIGPFLLRGAENSLEPPTPGHFCIFVLAKFQLYPQVSYMV